MPNTIKHYVHRVGRTARAGKKGRSVTLVGEQERKLLKEVVKKARTPLKTRIVPQEVIVKYKDKIANMAQDIVEIEQEEKEESFMRATENQLNKAKNLLENQKEMMNQQKRTWFQSHKERMKEKASLRLADHSALTGKKKKQDKGKKKSLTADDRALHEINKSQEYAARFSKKSFKPKRLRVFNEEETANHTKKKKSQKRKSAFDQELTNTGKSALKKFRSGPSYHERKEMGLPGKRFNPKSDKKRRKR